MSNKKFYQTKHFKKLKTKWYAKLKEDGFEDIEYHDPETGIGEGSPYLKGRVSPKNIDFESAKTFSDFLSFLRLFQSHLAQLRLNLPRKPHKASYKTLESFKNAQIRYKKEVNKTYYALLDPILLEKYLAGKTLREISAELRQHYTTASGLEAAPAHPATTKRRLKILLRESAVKQNSFSHPWIYCRLQKLKKSASVWARSSADYQAYLKERERLEELGQIMDNNNFVSLEK